MKILYSRIYILLAFTLALFACEKEQELEVLRLGENPVLTVSETELILTEEAATEEAARFSWTAADFGFNAPLRYVLEFDLEGNEFAAPQQLRIGTKLDTALLVQTLNQVVISLGVEPEATQNVAVRLLAQIITTSGAATDQVESVYSNTVILSISPYSTEVTYPAIYVPGAYQGWDPATATTLISVEDNGLYEGYVNFPDEESLEFKITSDPDWSGTNYGAADEEGVLSTDGGAGNLSVPAPGTYWITANTSDLSWSALPGGWAIIGDATPGGWDADTDMTYHREEDIWVITTDLTTGELKFRFDNGWDLNYGDDDTSNEQLNEGGANIAIAEAGTYEITLDMSDEQNPTYSIVKKD